MIDLESGWCCKEAAVRGGLQQLDLKELLLRTTSSGDTSVVLALGARFRLCLGRPGWLTLSWDPLEKREVVLWSFGKTGICLLSV